VRLRKINGLGPRKERMKIPKKRWGKKGRLEFFWKIWPETSFKSSKFPKPDFETIWGLKVFKLNFKTILLKLHEIELFPETSIFSPCV
jgi:hypothetical protein